MQSFICIGLLLMVAVLRLTNCQATLSVAERLALQEEREQVLFNVTYVLAAAHKATITQLDLTDEEAKTVCEPTVFGGIRVRPHPKTCSAFVECVTRKKNPFLVRTVYRSEAYIKTNPEQTFWNSEVSSAVLWNTMNNCASDPCKTSKPMTDGRSCFTYIACQHNSTSNAATGYQTYECPTNQSFNVNSGTCVVDATCRKPEGDRFTDLFCVASVPSVLTPGLPPQAYYNRTYLNLDNNQQITQATFCAAGLIFNSAQPEKCECVAQPAVSEACPRTLFNYSNQLLTGTQLWSSVVQEGNAVVENITTQARYPGWVRFNRADFDFFHASSLSNNELTGPFSLTLSFALSGQSAGNVALVSNSRDSSTCPTATLRVYLATARSVIVAEVTNINGLMVSVESAAVPNLVNSEVRVKLDRRNDGKLALTVDNGTPSVSDNDLGSYRLKATSCGLILAKSNGLDSFSGWMNNFSLIKNCLN